jgi:hypothetical protein
MSSSSNNNNNNIPPKTKTKPNQTATTTPTNKQRKTTFLQDELGFQRIITTQATAVSPTKFLSSITTPETKENETCGGHERTNERANG